MLMGGWWLCVAIAATLHRTTAADRASFSLSARFKCRGGRSGRGRGRGRGVCRRRVDVLAGCCPQPADRASILSVPLCRRVPIVVVVVVFVVVVLNVFLVVLGCCRSCWRACEKGVAVPRVHARGDGEAGIGRVRDAQVAVAGARLGRVLRFDGAVLVVGPCQPPRLPNDLDGGGQTDAAEREIAGRDHGPAGERQRPGRPHEARRGP